MFEEIKNDFLKETIYKGTLSNGLTLIFTKKKGFSSQYAMYATKYGSNCSSFVPIGESEPVTVPLGIAHFLEHKMFDNDCDINVMDEFAKNGASPNAYTSFNCTAYHFECTESFYDNLKLLVNFVNTPYFTPESVEKEKPIIAEELSMYDDDPDSVVFQNFLKSIYHLHPVKNNIGGDVENIRKITSDMLYLCYNNFYTPENMVLSIGGDLDPDELFAKAEEIISEDKRATRNGIAKKIIPDEPDNIVSGHTETFMDVSRPKVIFGYKGKPFGKSGKELLKKSTSENMALELFSNVSTSLYNKLYDSQIIDSTFSFGAEVLSDYSFGFFSAETERYDEMITIIKEELEKQKNTGFEEKAFERLKKSYIGAFIKSLNGVASTVSAGARYYLEGCLLFDYFDVIRSITKKDVEDAFSEMFNDGKTSVSLVLPRK